MGSLDALLASGNHPHCRRLYGEKQLQVAVHSNLGDTFGLQSLHQFNRGQFERTREGECKRTRIDVTIVATEPYGSPSL